MKSSPTKYWRLAPSSLQLEQSVCEQKQDVVVPEELVSKARPREGIVLAEWEAGLSLGRVRALGVVRQINQGDRTIKVSWVPAEITLRPSSSGRRWWSQTKPFFAFAPDVVQRYALDDMFAEHFPEFENMEFGKAPPTVNEFTTQQHYATPGYIYVIRSKFGFKIGKTVNLKQRTRLFEVKLPFSNSLEHYAWFEDYTRAERELHLQFHAKRLEGEWFDLDEKDLSEIKAKGKKIKLEGLQ